MAENDIYNSQERYERLKQNLHLLTTPPEERTDRSGKQTVYFCRNPKNLAYFQALFKVFEARDISYVRRVRICYALRLVCNATEKDLADISKEGDRDEINSIVAFMHQRCPSIETKSDFIKYLKFVWKHLFPEKDERGRFDETIIPYAVRHLTNNVDKSREKRRKDKISFEEFERIVQFFAYDPQMQFYLMFANESLVRPQEACYLRIGDIELYDSYAKIYLSEHGKEGVGGFLRCIDSYPYLVRWLENHPFRKDRNAYLFVSEKGRQQTPININKRLRLVCYKLGIRKAITAYSLKRNGVSFKRLAGCSDVEIQHTARWTSLEQLKIYDLTTCDDTFKIALVKRGLIQGDEKTKAFVPEIRKCSFCGTQNGFTNLVCDNCKRPLDRKTIEEIEKTRETEVGMLRTQLEDLKAMVMQMAKKEIDEVSKNNPQAISSLNCLR